MCIRDRYRHFGLTSGGHLQYQGLNAVTFQHYEVNTAAVFILRQPEKSAVDEHALANTDHRVLCEETKVLSSVNAHFAGLYMESIQIQRTLPLQ